MATAKTRRYHNLTLSLPLHIRGMARGKHELLQASLLKRPTSGWSGEQDNSCQYWGWQMESEFISPKCSTSVPGQGKREWSQKTLFRRAVQKQGSTLTGKPAHLLQRTGGERSFQKSGGCSPHFSGYRTACIKLYFYRAWIIPHSVRITGIILLSVSLTPAMLKIQKAPKSTMCCQFWTWLLHCLHLLTKSRSRCWHLSDQSV